MRNQVYGATDDAGLVSTAITGASLCVGCIARKTGVPPPRIEAIVTSLGETFKLGRGMGLCDACLSAKRVFRLG